jgi:hypothetical protein
MGFLFIWMIFLHRFSPNSRNPDTPAAAVAAVQQNIEMGSDIVKLFVGSYHSPDDIIHMPVDIARAAFSEGHRHGQLVFTHPSDLEGFRIAMDSGVDILAHAPSKVDGIDDALIKAMADRHMAMIPTLKLFSRSNYIERIREIVARFHAVGGCSPLWHGYWIPDRLRRKGRVPPAWAGRAFLP